MGASTAFHLATGGVPDVVVLERETLASGSTSRSAGGARLQFADELNVRSLETLGTAGDLVEVSVKANFRVLGKRYASRTQTVANAIHAAPAAELVTQLREVGQRLVQEARKSQGLDVSDRIELWWSAAAAETGEALREGAETVAAEVLAVAMTEGMPNAPLAGHDVPELGLTFWLRVVD